jgi:hypothetical protein
VEAIHPDAFTSPLMDRDLEGIVEVAAKHRGSLWKPPLSVDEYPGILQNGGLEVTPRRLEEHRHRL